MQEKNMLRKAVDLLLLFTIAFAPLTFSRLTADPFWVVEQFFFKFSVSALCAAFLFKIFIEKQYTAFKTPYNFALAGFMAANVLGALAAKNIPAFLNTVFTNGCYIMLFYLTVDFVSEEEDNYKKVLAALIIPAVMMAVYGLLQSLGIDFIPWETNFSFRAASTLGNPNFLAGHMVLVIPMVIALIAGARGGARAALVFSAVILTAALIVSQTRGAYIAFGVSVLMLFILLNVFDREGIRKYSKILIVCFAALVIGIAGYFVINKKAGSRLMDIITLKDESAHIRMSLWKNTMYMIRENFLLGSGAGNFPVKYSYYQSKALDFSYYKDSDFYMSGHAHNDYLQFLAEYGAPGAGCMFLFLGLIFYTGLRALSAGTGSKYLIAGALSSASGMMAHAFFNFPFIIVPTAAAFYAIAATASVEQDDYDIDDREIKTAGSAITAVLAIVFLACAVIFAQNLLSSAFLRAAKENDHFNRQQQAMEYASLAVEADPWNEGNYFFNGILLEKNGEMERAYNNYKKVYDMDPGSWEAGNAVFSYYASKGQQAGALEAGENLLKMSPYSIKAIKACGYAYYINSKYDKAIELYERALQDRPDNYDLLYHLSAVYGATGNEQKAAEYSLRAIAASPDNAGAWYNLAVSYYRQGDRAKSIQTIRTMLKAHPGDARAIELLKAVQK
jgi:O-antigen ligase/Flp pilus assembly protein TadD